MDECNLTLRDGDIILASFPKCGSTWMQYIVLSLLNNGDVEGIVPLQQAPFLDHLMLRNAIRKGKTKGMYSIENVQSALDAGVLGDRPPAARRVFKTHRPIDSLLWEGGVNGVTPGAKIILFHRNPKDVAISWFHQNVSNHRYKPDQLDDFVHHFLSDTVIFYPNICSFWLWYANWWKFAKDNPAVLVIPYEDLKRDLPAGIRRIAAHIGIEASDDLIRRVSQAAVFDSMKENLAGQKVPKLRRGVAGGWRDYLSGELLRCFDDVHARNTKELDMAFEFDFGDEPLAEKEQSVGRRHQISDVCFCWSGLARFFERRPSKDR